MDVKKIKIFEYSGLTLLILLSCITWYISYRSGLSITYNDAMSHLDIARSVIDNQQSGLSQLGSVWLPLNHILALTLIWNKWAWHSGFAGSIFSMAAYILASCGIYLTIQEITNNKLAATCGALAFSLNANFLYLQTTPLTEPLFIVITVYSFLEFVRFFKTDDSIHLVRLGWLGFFDVLIRYDGWFITGMEIVLIAAQQYFIHKRKIAAICGRIILIALPAIFGIAMWLLWNLLIFKNALYFLNGPYSAHAQQITLQQHGGLITKHNIGESIIAFWYAMVSNIGYPLLLSSIIGAIFYLFTNKQAKLEKALVLLAVSSPILFNIISLFLGFSIINLPQLHWNPSGDLADQWFNVRYGITALPFVAICIGLLVQKKKFLVALLIAGIIAQNTFLLIQKPITIIDGTIGSSSFANNDVAQFLKSETTPTDEVLLSTSFFNAVAFKSGLNLKQFIYEGDSKEWNKALLNPEGYTKWLVMANGDIGEPVYTSLVKNGHNQFETYYTLAYRGNHANIYRLRTEQEIYIQEKGNQFFTGTKQFSIRGVNSYDLAYRTPQQIDDSLADLQSEGVNTVRFWLFGEGQPNEFQPAAGIFNQSRFKNLDYLVASAKQHNIRLIPVLVNNLQDYGGKDQYLRWVGLNPEDAPDAFYTNTDIINLFKNYINAVISRVNTVTGNEYRDDPTILSWEVINEPRQDNETATYIQPWLKNISGYIHSIDAEHLVSAGIDQYEFKTSSLRGENICDTSGIDFCSYHFYLDQDGQITLQQEADADQAITDFYQSAKEINKPIIMGEIGISKAVQPFGNNPFNELMLLQAKISSTGYNGSLIWNWALDPDTSYGFSPSGDSSGVYNQTELGELLRH